MCRRNRVLRLNCSLQLISCTGIHRRGDTRFILHDEKFLSTFISEVKTQPRLRPKGLSPRRKAQGKREKFNVWAEVEKSNPQRSGQGFNSYTLYCLICQYAGAPNSSPHVRAPMQHLAREVACLRSSRTMIPSSRTASSRKHVANLARLDT